MAVQGFFFTRNGAVVARRDSFVECKDYAARCIGWDVHQGKDFHGDEFAGGTRPPMPSRRSRGRVTVGGSWTLDWIFRRLMGCRRSDLVTSA
jgi:hypothetical protein